MIRELRKLAELLASAKNFVIFTGAGCSTEAGVPDFRSPGGWWKQMNPETVARPDVIEKNYGLFHGFYEHRINGLQNIEPHQGHEVIAKWQKAGLVKGVVTQNVDELHQMSGCTDVVELHGSIRTFRCQRCGGSASEKQFLDREKCSHCETDEKLRPNVVLFSESLPDQAWGQAIDLIRVADLLIVIGTSLQVAPANKLPFYCRGKKVLLNVEPVENHEDFFDLFIRGKAGEILVAADQLLQGMA